MAAKPVETKRKLWSEESMKAAVQYVLEDGGGLRETSRLYNVPVETLRRRVNGSVSIDCRPGPSTVLTEEEEEHLANYLVQMSDMGFGLSPDAVKNIAYRIVEKNNRKHPFKNNAAGQDWFKGFCRRHPKLTIRMPQPLSYCRAISSNKETIDTFFGKLGSLYGRLNLISKPMNVYNVDESGVTIVHRPGRVVAELGRQKVYAVTSAERGKTHTVLACVSASGCALPPLIVYPRKKSVPDKLKEDAVPGTVFCNSDNGWINKEIYLHWFELFLKMIPKARPVLIIQDGHASHVTIDLIELARANSIHILCLPAHTTHVLQPLDVGVFKSFKANFNKACHKYIAEHPGRVITTDVIASLVGAAWPHSFTPNNIMSGFRKCGIFPINPGAVTDRQLAPSKAFQCKDKVESTVTESSLDNTLFTQEEQKLYQKRYEEGYNIPDPSYVAWLKIYHPSIVLSAASSENSSLPSSASCTNFSSEPRSNTSDVLSEILVLPKPKTASSRRQRRKGLNSKAVCITEDEVLQKLKAEKEEKIENEKKKAAKKMEKMKKKKAKELEKLEKKQQNEEKKRQKEKKKQQKEKEMQKSRNKAKKSVNGRRGKISENVKLSSQGHGIESEEDSTEAEESNSSSISEEDINDVGEECAELRNESDTEEDHAECPKCGLCFEDDDGLWICCDNCNMWYDFKCAGIKHIPKFYYCEGCK